MLTAEIRKNVASLFDQYCKRFGSPRDHNGDLKSLHLSQYVAKAGCDLPACVLLAALSLLMMTDEAGTPEVEIENAVAAMKAKYIAVSEGHGFRLDPDCLTVAELYEDELVKCHWGFHSDLKTSLAALRPAATARLVQVPPSRTTMPT